MNWEVGDVAADRLMVENLARRLLGRKLASEQLRPKAGEPGKMIDPEGRTYGPVMAWATDRGFSPVRASSVSVAFVHQGRAVQVLTGADKILVDGEESPLGAFVLEVGNQPYAPLDAMAATLGG
jgi:hypothetical protein